MKAVAWAPLAPYVADREQRRHAAATIGVTERTLFRWQQQGRIPIEHADGLAVWAGEHAFILWPDLLEHEIAAQREAYNARKAAEARRRYARDAEARAAKYAKRKAYYQENAEYERARERRRYHEQGGAERKAALRQQRKAAA